jgi:hypothetical protein
MMVEEKEWVDRKGRAFIEKAKKNKKGGEGRKGKERKARTS